jgi:hypothetical protein
MAFVLQALVLEVVLTKSLNQAALLRSIHLPEKHGVVVWSHTSPKQIVHGLLSHAVNELIACHLFQKRRAF